MIQHAIFIKFPLAHKTHSFEKIYSGGPRELCRSGFKQTGHEAYCRGCQQCRASQSKVSGNDGNRILNIIVSDKDYWLDENGDHSSYYFNDFDLNGDVNVQDKSLWLENNGKFSDVKWEN